MVDDLHQLVARTQALTGAEPPAVLGDDAPTLGPTPQSLYAVALVGGKEVGKTSLVNLIAGRALSQPTNIGRGTDRVVAYCHTSVQDAAREMLADVAGERFELVTHDVNALAGQVLLDLPDVDSVYGDHLELTRRVLRAVLYPVWVLSIEKYADQRPQQLLAAVAEGNDPGNFLFVLNKADQVSAEDAAAVAQDYAGRVQRLLQLQQSPRVMVVSARRPDDLDGPAMRNVLSQGRSEKAVQLSRVAAQRQRQRSVLTWANRQDLPGKLRRAEQGVEAARQVIAEELAGPIAGEWTQRAIEAEGYRLSVTHAAVARRLSGWPILGVLEHLAAPLLAVRRINADADRLPPLEPPLDDRIAAAFARVRDVVPTAGEAYDDAPPWQPMHAAALATQARREVSSSLAGLRQRVVNASRPIAVLAPLRWLLTVGAIIWFPLGQPLLQAWLDGGLGDVIALAIAMISVQHLLASATMIIVWLVALWLWVRWRAATRAERILSRVEDENHPSSRLLEWCATLLSPLERRSGELRTLILDYQRFRPAA